MTAPKVVFDAKTLEVRSADLGVDYNGQLAVLFEELAQMRSFDGRVTRALKALGVTARPMKEADLKKVAAAPNAAQLIKEFEKADLEVSLTPMAWGDAHRNMDKREAEAREILFNQMAKPIADRMTAINKEIEELKKKIQEFNEELKLLKGKKDSLLADITLKTNKAPRVTFNTRYKAIRAEGETLVAAYKNFNIGDASKYIKKKK